MRLSQLPWGRQDLGGHWVAVWGSLGRPGAGVSRPAPVPGAAGTPWPPLRWHVLQASRSAVFTLLPVSVFTGRQAVPPAAALCDPGFGLATALFFLGTLGLWTEPKAGVLGVC